jgi:parvulin-like peptidyl-prolyl isomerase
VINIKKIIFLLIKSVLGITALLTIVLFFYAAFFYESPLDKENTLKSETVTTGELNDIEKEKKLKKEKELKELEEAKKKIKVESVIEDGLYATVGNKAITRSDIVNEIKTILILNDRAYSPELKDQLQQTAIKSLIKRNIKKIEIERNNFLQFNEQELQKELLRLANAINKDIAELKNLCKSNNLDFSIIEDQVKLELMWNSLIFEIYKNRISINIEEINEQLNLIQGKKKIKEYLISELVIESVEKNQIELKINEIKNKIKTEGFESIATSLSISDSSARGGDLGWINENIISEKLKAVITNTPVGNISEPILLSNGILFFKVRDKRVVEKKVDMEKVKDQLVNSEKSKILNMHSTSHFNNLRRSISVKFFQ